MTLSGQNFWASEGTVHALLEVAQSWWIDLMELAGNKHCCTSDQLEVLFGWEDAFGQKSVDQVHSYEKRFRKQF